MSESELAPILLDLWAQIASRELTLDLNPLIHFFHIHERPSRTLTDLLTDIIISTDPSYVFESRFPIFVSHFHTGGQIPTVQKSFYGKLISMKAHL
jgi:hypothetical protein